MIEHTIDIPIDVLLQPYSILKAGDLTCIYEAGNLRYIKCGDTEIIRMIYGALRDENWETIRPEINNLVIAESAAGFHITYDGAYNEAGVSYFATFIIEGKPDNTIRFTMRGKALSEFKRNRIGLCVHHPLKECKGKPIEITMPDGEKYTASFPELVAPHQPFKEVQQMKWTPSRDITAQIIFTGDIFETEDQRNWSDSSYKTYSTPLSIPIPAVVTNGSTLHQEVLLSVMGSTKEASPGESRQKLRNENFLPKKLGFCRVAHQPELTDAELDLLRQLKMDHYRAELSLGSPSWIDQLAEGVATAKKLGTRLELVLFFEGDYDQQLNSLMPQLSDCVSEIYSILLLDRQADVTPPLLMQKAFHLLKHQHRSLKVGYGTNGFFAELNRNRPHDLPHDFVSFSLNPQMHQSDTRSLIENLECQPDIINTIRSFTDKDIHVSPVTLKKRKSNDFVGDATDHLQDDERQHSEFAAAWTRFCLQQLAGADVITFYEMTGPNGLLFENKISPVYYQFRK